MTLDKLSNRDREILAGVMAGCSNKEIGYRVGLAHNTVKLYMGKLLRKCGASSRMALATMFQDAVPVEFARFKAIVQAVVLTQEQRAEVLALMRAK